MLRRRRGELGLIMKNSYYQVYGMAYAVGVVVHQTVVHAGNWSQQTEINLTALISACSYHAYVQVPHAHMYRYTKEQSQIHVQYG